MAYCSNCGKELLKDAGACPNCGQKSNSPGSGALYPGKNSFLNTGFGVALLGALLLAVLIGAMASPMFWSVQNLLNIFSQTCPLAVAAMGVGLTHLSKGADLSGWFTYGFVCALMAPLAQITGSVFSAAVICLTAGAVIGLINGAVAAYTPVPAPATSLALSVMFYILWKVILTAMPQLSLSVVPVVLDVSINYEAVGGIVFLLAFALAYILSIFMKKHKAPSYKRKKCERCFFWAAAYIICGVMCAAAGILMTCRMKMSYAAMISPGQIWQYVFIASGVYISRAFDSRFAAVPSAILCALIIGIIRNVMILMGINTYILTTIEYIIMLIFAALALGLTRRRDMIWDIRLRFQKN